MSLIRLMMLGALFTMVGIFALSVPNTHASIEELRARMEERRIEREARRAQRQEKDNSDSGETQDNKCNCRARLSFNRPTLFINGGTVRFIPNLDIDINSRGDSSDPSWTATLKYNGSTSYESEDIVPPAPVAFSGEQTVFSGACGNDFSFDGYQLPAVNLTGLTRSLLGPKQELDGKVELQAEIAGCGFDNLHRNFGFNMKEFGSLRTRSWRSVR
jgi:hypothetical protein